MKRDLDVFSARLRGLQAIYNSSHAALVNWGRWSRDRYKIFPRVAAPSLWDQFKRDENDEYGEVTPDIEVSDEAPVKAEAAEMEEYSERDGTLLDERLHGPGGLCCELRYALRAAYVTREVPDEQFPRLAGCSEDAFLERMESSLMFVQRFV